MSSVMRLLVGLLFLAALLGEGAYAAQKSRKNPTHLGHNSDTVGIVAGPSGSLSLRMAADIATVLEKDLRVLPIAGKGPLENLRDLLYLKGVDAAVLQSDVLAHVEKTGLHGDAAERIHYVTKLFSREVHLIVRRSLADIGDLAGRKVNLGPADSSSAITGAAIFQALGVRVEATGLQPWEALEELKAGEIDGLLYVDQKPVEMLTAISPGDDLKLLPLELQGESGRRYPPALLTAADYPGLIEARGEVATVAVGEMLAVFNWKRGGARYSRVKRFVDRFLERFEALSEPPSSQSWREVNLAAQVAGWERDDVAETWLAAARKRASKSKDPSAEALRSAFRRFLETSGEAAALSTGDQTELFQRFLNWKEAGGQ